MIEIYLLIQILFLFVCMIYCIKIHKKIWHTCKYIKAIYDIQCNIEENILTDTTKIIKLLYTINNKINKNGNKKSTKCDKGQ